MTRLPPESMRLRVLGAINIRRRQCQGVEKRSNLYCRYGGGGGCQNTKKSREEQKKGVDFETTSFMNGPLVRASGHVIHAHSPLHIEEFTNARVYKSQFWQKHELFYSFWVAMDLIRFPGVLDKIFGPLGVHKLPNSGLRGSKLQL